MLCIAAIALLCAAIFVNGFTDAPNAIAVAVSTKTLTLKRACLAGAAMNFLGALAGGVLTPQVLHTVIGLIDFRTSDPARAQAAVLSSFAAIALWGIFCWQKGLPTSESHGLLLGLLGGAFALNAWQGIGISQFATVCWGMLLSLALGYGLAFISGRLYKRLQKRAKQALHPQKAIRLCAYLLSFLHGAQDGQKFIGAFWVLVCSFYGGISFSPLPVILATACMMALGTFLGGGRIIDTICHKLVHTTLENGVCADVSSCICLLGLTMVGAPVSTTHVKVASLVGAARAVEGQRADKRTLWGLAGAWAFTFPACFALGYFFTKLVLCFL